MDQALQVPVQTPPSEFAIAYRKAMQALRNQPLPVIAVEAALVGAGIGHILAPVIGIGMTKAMIIGGVGLPAIGVLWAFGFMPRLAI